MGSVINADIRLRIDGAYCVADAVVRAVAEAIPASAEVTILLNTHDADGRPTGGKVVTRAVSGELVERTFCVPTTHDDGQVA